MIGWWIHSLSRSILFLSNGKNNTNQALFPLTWLQSAKTFQGRCPTVLGLQCYGLTVACDNGRANANASSSYSSTMLSPSAKDSEGYFTSDIIKRSVCLFPTWRRADRERLKFLVRHREWDNIVAVWQQPKAEEKLQVHRLEAEEARAITAEVVWAKPTHVEWGGDDDDECLHLVASLSLNSLSRNT